MVKETNPVKNGCKERALGHLVNYPYVGGRSEVSATPFLRTIKPLPGLNTIWGSECVHRGAEVRMVIKTSTEYRKKS